MYKKVFIILLCVIGVMATFSIFIFKRTMKVERLILWPERIELEDSLFSCSVVTMAVSNPFIEGSPKGYEYRIEGEKLFIMVKYVIIGNGGWPLQIFIEDNLININQILLEDKDKNKLVYERQ